MSLEAAIQENTAAVKELIQALTSGKSVAATTKVAEAKAPEVAEKVTKKVTKPAVVVEPEVADEEIVSGEKQPEYSDVSAAIVSLAKVKGRQAALDVLATFGLDSAKAAKPEQYAEIITATQAAQEESSDIA